MNAFLKKLYDNRSTVLTVASSIGVILTGWLSFRAGKKSEKPNRKWTIYIPPVTVGALTIVGIVASHTIDAKQITALTATCAYLTMERDELENAIRERYGEDTLKEIKEEVHKKVQQKVTARGETVEETGNGDLLCIEGYSGRMFRSSYAAVKRACLELNRRFRNGEYVCLNDFYKLLGIGVTRFGNEFGWAANEDYYEYKDGIKYELTFIKAEECNDGRDEDELIIDIYTYPMQFWMEV